jgi:hypothetical protein
MRARSLLLTSIVALGAFVLLLAVWFHLLPLFLPYIPMDYVVEAEFQELPPDDKELEEWLFAQPGVYIGFVERDNRRIVAVWGNCRTSYYDPVTPNLRDEFEKFGYKGIISYREQKDYRDK